MIMTLFPTRRYFRSVRYHISFFLLMCAVWIFARNSVFSSTYSERNNQVVEGVLNVDTRQKWTPLHLRNSSEGNFSFVRDDGVYVTNAPYVIESATRRQELLAVQTYMVTLGVFAPKNRGKWGNEYVCSDNRIHVKAIQSDNYSILRDSAAIFFPESSLKSVQWRKLKL